MQTYLFLIFPPHLEHFLVGKANSVHALLETTIVRTPTSWSPSVARAQGAESRSLKVKEKIELVSITFCLISLTLEIGRVVRATLFRTYINREKCFLHRIFVKLPFWQLRN
jgi:hypothetical protein